MAKLLLEIFVGFVVSTSVLFGEELCSHYDDEDCVHPNAVKNGYYTNQWSVYMPGISKDEAKQLFEDNGFDYLGQIIKGIELYLVTKKGTPEKHVMPDEKTIELLKNQPNVQSVVQKHVLENSVDEVFSIVDNTNTECQSLDPGTIKLNDGSDNLMRVQPKGDEAAAATTYTTARPSSGSGSVKVQDGQPDDTDESDSAEMATYDVNDEVSVEAMMAATAGLLPPSGTDEWTLVGGDGPYFGEVRDETMSFGEYPGPDEYAGPNMFVQAGQLPETINMLQLGKDLLNAYLLNGGQLSGDKLSADATTSDDHASPAL